MLFQIVGCLSNKLLGGNCIIPLPPTQATPPFFIPLAPESPLITPPSPQIAMSTAWRQRTDSDSDEDVVFVGPVTERELEISSTLNETICLADPDARLALHGL